MEKVFEVAPAVPSVCVFVVAQTHVSLMGSRSVQSVFAGAIAIQSDCSAPSVFDHEPVIGEPEA